MCSFVTFVSTFALHAFSTFLTHKPLEISQQPKSNHNHVWPWLLLTFLFRFIYTFLPTPINPPNLFELVFCSLYYISLNFFSLGLNKFFKKANTFVINVQVFVFIEYTEYLHLIRKQRSNRGWLEYCNVLLIFVDQFENWMF
jgi:hypothetical protein